MMFPCARRLTILSAACLLFSVPSLLSQSQPDTSPKPAEQTAPQTAPQNPAQVPPNTTSAPTPAAAQPPAQTPGTLPEQAAPAEAPSTPPQAADGKDEKKPGKKTDDKPIPTDAVHNASIWRDPGDIASKDMFFGEGGQSGQPVAPFTFLSEDLNGTNPKFDARDANGTKWRVKLGEEARPEIVASRLLWAIGYYVNDDYNLHLATVQGLHLKRGAGRIHNGEQIIDARFARKPGKETKVAIWEWKTCPFRDTREFNGLRVMMAVLNSWDLKDVNNAVYTNKKTGHETFLVSDIGATFATNTLETSRAKDKGNVNSYVGSKFITKTTPTTVDFGTPGAPTAVLLKSGGVLAGDYFKRRGFDWIGEDIPREDARWVGNMLGQLSHQQLVDAFRAGNFPPESIEQYVTVLEGRIAQLKAL